MAMNYNQTLSNLRDAIADIQTALNDIGLDGSQSMAQWASQLETVSSTLQGLRDQISADDTDFENIYDAIVQKGQSPDEEDRDTYAPAILAISGGSNYQQKTVTPSASQQVVSADSGYDALSQVTVNGSSNLVPANIKSGVEIFGVTGTAETGGVTLNPHPTTLQYAGCQNDTSHTDVLPADGSWTTEVDLANINAAQGVRYLFYNNTTITSVDLTGWDFSNLTDVRNMFSGCTNLVTITGSINLNKSTSVSNAFYNCSSLVNLPIKSFGFGATTNTITLDLSTCTSLDANTMIQNMNTNSSGKTRIIKLAAAVYNNLSATTTAAAASKNITLQSA